MNIFYTLYESIVDDDTNASYRGAHTPPDRDSGSPIHDLSATYPDDIYSSNGARYYGHFGDNRDNAAISVIQSVRGKPNAKIKIYRAVPKYDDKVDQTNVKELTKKIASLYRLLKLSPHLKDDTHFMAQIAEHEAKLPKKINISIRAGDWVTTVQSYAVYHGMGTLLGNYRILSKTVNAKDLFTTGDSIFEFGYNPS